MPLLRRGNQEEQIKMYAKSTIPKCPRQMIDQSKAKAMSRIVDGPGKTHDVSHAISS